MCYFYKWGCKKQPKAQTSSVHFNYYIYTNVRSAQRPTRCMICVHTPDEPSGETDYCGILFEQKVTILFSYYVPLS